MTLPPRLPSFLLFFKVKALHTEWLSSASRASSSGLPLGGRKGPQTLICFSHLRWDFVFQRPQHLMTRFARDRRVIFWEEPIGAAAGAEPSLQAKVCPQSGVIVITPMIAEDVHGPARDEASRRSSQARISTTSPSVGSRSRSDSRGSAPLYRSPTR